MAAAPILSEPLPEAVEALSGRTSRRPRDSARFCFPWLPSGTLPGKRINFRAHFPSQNYDKLIGEPIRDGREAVGCIGNRCGICGMSGAQRCRRIAQNPEGEDLREAVEVSDDP